MLQYNLSLFVDPSIEKNAIIAISKILMPEFAKFDSILHTHLFEIDSHQEPDSKGFSLQFWIKESDNTSDEIEQIVSTFFAAEFPNQFVYFPSKLILIHTIQ
jgi:hypothetical protein